MLTSNIRAYEGKEPYIFISYAHKDSARVLPILAQLQSRGYRVWYDEGIAPGSEWPENIAQHLNGCAVTVAFVSNNSMASPNCRREITYALSKKKPFLGIFLEQAEMSPGMELQMSAQQCVMQYSYRDADLFYEKVCSCPDLQPCKQQDAVPVAAPPAAAPARAQTSAVPAKTGLLKQKPWLLAVAGGALAAIILAIVLLAGGSDDPAGPSGSKGPQLGVHTTGSTAGTTQTPPETTEPEDTEPEGTEPVDTEPEGTEPVDTEPEGTEPVDTEPEDTEPEDTEPEDTEPVDPGDEDDAFTVTIFPDKVVDRDTDYLYLYSKTITADTVRKINKLESLETLSLNNCTLEPGVLDSLGGGDRIHCLYFVNCSGIADYSFLTNFEQLWELQLNACCVTDANFPRLASDVLDSVDLSGNSEFTDLSKLSQLSELYALSIAGTGVTSLNGFPIEQLSAIDFSNTAISDISRLSGCANLRKIYADMTAVTDISPLAKLENISTLSFSGCALGKVTAPFYSLYLSELCLSNCGLTDISGFAHLTQLRTVYLSGNSLSDVSFLRESCDKLQELSISNLPLTPGTNLDFLSECEALEVLYINGISLQNLNFCRTMTGLVTLNASGCGLTDISGLKDCVALRYICLSKNQITDISALSGLEESYITLDLAYNQLTDVSALADVPYKTLCLVGNAQLDLSTVTVNGTTLLVSYAEGMETALPDNFIYYGFLSVPMNKMITLKETYGNFMVTFLSSEEEFFDMAAQSNLYYQ